MGLAIAVPFLLSSYCLFKALIIRVSMFLARYSMRRFLRLSMKMDGQNGKAYVSAFGPKSADCMLLD